jgi:nucleoside-diphosphate-sugar epimerase
MSLEESYRGKRVLITGGLGFIGSSIAHRIVELEAEVTIMDSKLEGLGANYFNIRDIKDRVTLSEADITDEAAVIEQARGKDVIFDMAAQVDYKRSNREPEFDARINFQGHQNILEACRTGNPNCRIVFPGSRTQYGKVTEADLPVKEDHPLETNLPPSVYTSHKTAMEMRLRLLNRDHQVDAIVLRLTNPFGPRAQIHNNSYCVANWMIGQALQGNPLKIFGDGKQLRDYVYIDDVVEAFAVAGTHPDPQSRVYNVGSGKGISFKDMAHAIADIVGGVQVEYIKYPKDHKVFETGHFYADVSRAKAELGWEPKASLEEGLRKTVDYYKENLGKYLRQVKKAKQTITYILLT